MWGRLGPPRVQALLPGHRVNPKPIVVRGGTPEWRFITPRMRTALAPERLSLPGYRVTPQAGAKSCTPARPVCDVPRNAHCHAISNSLTFPRSNL